jgi:hypothetical protein
VKAKVKCELAKLQERPNGDMLTSSLVLGVHQQIKHVSKGYIVHQTMYKNLYGQPVRNLIT